MMMLECSCSCSYSYSQERFSMEDLRGRERDGGGEEGLPTKTYMGRKEGRW